ncbi:hypothetical protein VCUG_01494 [Vavraia culicis subsp. floridensis]|uniref:Uncharacterized protein n=1 Tax=Vavraia culicis (isolate floridensis) TaxID=948595 RepID=L2GTV4_VAVCU|nr:uncharacterized protein VCUG_01494 [Vavraia culicis subsp. floridensis]ELA47049.1 hypothetical protein VCUG_01494 [Vavraia culicis subsp. floridensis]
MFFIAASVHINQHILPLRVQLLNLVHNIALSRELSGIVALRVYASDQRGFPQCVKSRYTLAMRSLCIAGSDNKANGNMAQNCCFLRLRIVKALFFWKQRAEGFS